MGGLRKKIPIALIKNKASRAVAFSKRTRGLYSKASKLCLLSDSQIAIMATPLSFNSGASFFSFGHSSVDNVVAAFLANQRPGEGRGLGFWWEDESLAKSGDPEELRCALDSTTKMLQDLKDAQNRHETHQKQTFNPQSCSSSLCIQDDVTLIHKGDSMNTEEQTPVAYDNRNNNCLLGNLDRCDQELGLDQIFDFDFEKKSECVLMNLERDDVSMVTMNQNMLSRSEAAEDGGMGIHRYLDEDVLPLSYMDHDHMLNICDTNSALLNVGGSKRELYVDQNIDFEAETKSESLTMNSEMNDVSMVTANLNQFSDSDEAVVDGESVVHRDLYGENIHLSNLDEDLMLRCFDSNNYNYNNNVLPENLGEFYQELDLDQIINFETNYGGFMQSLETDGVSMVTTDNNNLGSDSETVEDGGSVTRRGLADDNLCFSDYFNELTSIAPI